MLRFTAALALTSSAVNNLTLRLLQCLHYGLMSISALIEGILMLKLAEGAGADIFNAGVGMFKFTVGIYTFIETGLTSALI